MKTICLFTFCFCLTAACLAQPNLPLTNDVPIVDYGMRLALCDNFGEVTNAEQMFSEIELGAAKDIAWVLHNATTNQISVIYLGETNSFDIKLFNTNGTEMIKTRKGKAMSAGPVSQTKVNANPYIRRESGLLIRDFPKLTELFQFPSDGIYILEVRYWGWSPTKQRLILSEPVRLRVIKGDIKAASSATK